MLLIANKQANSVTQARFMGLNRPLRAAFGALLLGVLPLLALAQPAESAHSAAGTMHHAPSLQLGSAVAFAPDGRLWLVGVNAQGQLFVQSTAPDDTGRWDAARVLDTQGDVVAADGESRPKIAFGPNGVVVISYAKPLKKPYTAFIRMLRSTDGGQNFSAPFTVHADRQEITHRFDAIAFDAAGALHTVWIDKRDLEAAPKVGGKPSYRGAAIYRNVSRDGGASFGPDLRVADHSCECCRIALTTAPDGQVRALWRHVFEPNVRDHAFAALERDSTREPVIVRATQDDWRIDACPHHGPSLSPDALGGFHAVWFGVRQQGGVDVGAVRYGRLQADGSPVADSVRPLPDDAAEHAEVLSDGARVAIVWRSTQGALTRARAWLSNDNGAHFVLRELGEVKGPNDFVRLAQFGPHWVAVWRTAQETQIHALSF